MATASSSNYSPITKGSIKIITPYIDDEKSENYRKYKQLCSGVDIAGSDVFSLCPGTVVILMYKNYKYTVTIRYDDSHYVTYSELIDCEVKLNSFVDEGQRVGACKSLLHFEYANSTESRWPVRIGKVDAYKHDPTDLLTGYKDIFQSQSNTDIQGSNLGDDLFTVEYHSDDTNSSETTEPAITVNLDQKELTPYIITVDRNTKTLSRLPEMISSLGVSGGLVELGYLYNASNHKRVTEFKSPKAYSQYNEFKKYKLPVGWMLYGRAHTVSEATQEIKEMSIPLRSHPPTLGVWIRLSLTKNVDTNDKILNRYRDELYKFGLKNRIGICITRSALKNRITWSIHSSYWFLWLIDHSDNAEDIALNIQMSAFSVAGEYS